MKTILLNDTKESMYLFQDDTPVEIGDDSFIFQGELVNANINNQNASVVPCGQTPDDWIGMRYVFDNDTWVLNPLRPDLHP